MRRNKALAELLKGCFHLFLHITVAQCNFKKSARGFFESYGIVVSNEDKDIDYDELVVEENLVELRGVGEVESNSADC